MDMGFSRRAQRFLADCGPARLDHAMLVAAVAARQSATAAARAQARATLRLTGIADDPLVELVLSGPDWREAADAQAGRFSRAVARRCAIDGQGDSP
jgi:hypothetical protein